MLQMIHRVIPFNSLINRLPKEGEVGIPKKFDFIKHMQVAILTSTTDPWGAKVVSAAILEKGEDLRMSDERSTILDNTQWSFG